MPPPSELSSLTYSAGDSGYSTSPELLLRTPSSADKEKEGIPVDVTVKTEVSTSSEVRSIASSKTVQRPVLSYHSLNSYASKSPAGIIVDIEHVEVSQWA